MSLYTRARVDVRARRARLISGGGPSQMRSERDGGDVVDQSDARLRPRQPSQPRGHAGADLRLLRGRSDDELVGVERDQPQRVAALRQTVGTRSPPGGSTGLRGPRASLEFSYGVSSSRAGSNGIGI